MSKQNWTPRSLAAQAMGKIDPTTRGVVPPIHVSTTYIRDPDNAYSTGFVYGRPDNETVHEAEALRGLAGGAVHLPGDPLYDEARMPFAHQPVQLAPSAHGAAEGPPVLPDLGAVERMQVEQEVRELGRRQDVALDAALRADEERTDLGARADERAGDRDAGIQVPARPAAREDDVHAGGGAEGHAITAAP